MSITARDMDICCAVTRVWVRDGRTTVRSVADEVGLTVDPTWQHLVKLRRAGLVEWVDNQDGTMRPGSAA
jgi:predicted ArsR family transcriptional regulator